MEFTEIWDKIWLTVVSLAGSGALSAIIASIFAFINNARIQKMITTAQKLSETEANKGIDKIKTITYKHDIQPIVESELKKINEYSVEVLKKELLVVKLQYDQLIHIVKALSHYFDNAYGINEDAREELNQYLDEAEKAITPTQSAETQVIIEERTEETVVEPVKTSKKTTVSR